jgi:membrane protein YqaA with SNARE-associated domain
VATSIDPTAIRGAHRRLAIGALATALISAAVVAIVRPEWRPLVTYGLYAIPAHLLISFLANEPMLLATAKLAPPLAVATAGTLGCLVAITLDYALIGWLVNHRLIRTELDDSRGFRTAERWFGKAPFLLILASAVLPVPFYPVKILAIAGEYPLARFALALLLGRLPRFYLLALGGHRYQAPNSALLSAAVGLSLIALWGIWRRIRRNRGRARP